MEKSKTRNMLSGNVGDNYAWLAREGSLQDIQDAYEENKKAFTTYVFGEERETFLMLVLKNDREYDIIRFCLDVDMKVKDRVSKSRRTPLMYASRYCSDERVITLILKSSFLFAQNRRAHVLQQDRKGYDAFAYSRNNPNYKVYLELYKYAPDPGLTLLPQDDPSYTGDGSDDSPPEVSNTRTTTPPPASPAERAAPPPPDATSSLSTPPPDQDEDMPEESSPAAQLYLR